MCVHMCQSRWIPAKSSIGRLDTTLLWTSKELSSWERFLDFESEDYVASYLGRAQPPLSIVLLLIFYSSYPQKMNSSCSSCGEKGISFLNMIAKQVKYGLKNSKYLYEILHFVFFKTFYICFKVCPNYFLIFSCHISYKIKMVGIWRRYFWLSLSII